MDGALIGVLATVIINLLVVAFCGGKLWQKAEDNEKRLTRIENKLNGFGSGCGKPKKGRQ